MNTIQDIIETEIVALIREIEAQRQSLSNCGDHQKRKSHASAIESLAAAVLSLACSVKSAEAAA